MTSNKLTEVESEKVIKNHKNKELHYQLDFLYSMHPELTISVHVRNGRRDQTIILWSNNVIILRRASRELLQALERITTGTSHG